MAPEKHKSTSATTNIIKPSMANPLPSERAVTSVDQPRCASTTGLTTTEHALPSDYESSAPKTQHEDPPISTDATQVNAAREFILLIVLSNPVSIRDITSHLESIDKNGSKIHGNRKVPKILLNSRNDHSIVITYLNSNDHHYHTFGFKSERQKNFSNLNSNGHHYHTFGFKSERQKKIFKSFEPEEIHEAFKTHIDIKTVRQYIKKSTDGQTVKLPIFQITTSPEVSLAQVNRNPTLFHHTFRAEKFQTSGQLAQCYRCQNFGHASYHCNLPPHCVRCAGNHDLKECDKQGKLCCANCRQEHTASYRKCPSRAPYIESQSRRPNVRHIDAVPGALHPLTLATTAHFAESSDPLLTASTLPTVDKADSDLHTQPSSYAAAAVTHSDVGYLPPPRPRSSLIRQHSSRTPFSSVSLTSTDSTDSDLQPNKRRSSYPLRIVQLKHIHNIR